MDMHRYYARLVGSRITGFRMDPDAYGSDPFPTFTLRLPDGDTLEMSLSRDPEGNGGGFAFIARPGGTPTEGNTP